MMFADVLLDWAGDGADIVVVNDEKNVLIVLGQSVVEKPGYKHAFCFVVQSVLASVVLSESILNFLEEKINFKLLVQIHTYSK